MLLQWCFVPLHWLHIQMLSWGGKQRVKTVPRSRELLPYSYPTPLLPKKYKNKMLGLLRLFSQLFQDQFWENSFILFIWIQFSWIEKNGNYMVIWKKVNAKKHSLQYHRQYYIISQLIFKTNRIFYVNQQETINTHRGSHSNVSLI